jgi:uncharacterized protein YbcI
VTTHAEADPARQRVRSERGLMLAAISNAVVRIHKQFYGKGPTKARAHLSESALVVVLESGLMRSERTLCERGQADTVVRARLTMQRSIEPELRAVIEGQLRRPVRSLMNALDPQNELEVVICILAPTGAEMPHRRELYGECPLDGHAEQIER